MRRTLTILTLALLGASAASAQNAPRTSSQWSVYTTSNSSIPDNYVGGIAFNKNGMAWMACQGLSAFNGSQWRNYDITTLGLAVDSKGNIWCASDLFGGSVTKFDGSKSTQYNSSNSGLPSDWVTAIAVDKNDVVYAGCTYGMTLGRFDGTTWTTLPPDTNSFGYVRALHHDGTHLWVGSGNYGLMRLDGTTWTTFNPDNSNFPASEVTSVTHAADGTIWAGTFGGGVVSFDGDTFVPYGKGVKGFPSDSVSSVMVDSKGMVWAGTDHGLARFDGTSWTVIDKAHSGLPSDFVNGIAESQDGRIWIGTMGGLAILDPSTSSVSSDPGNETSTSDVFVAAVYPNPARDRVALAVDLDRPGHLRCMLVDELGRSVATVERSVPSGHSSFAIPVEGVAAGYYHCVVDNGGERKVIGVVVEGRR